MRQLEHDRKLNMGKSHHKCYGKDEYYKGNEEGPCS